MCSDAQNALLKVLNESHVPKNQMQELEQIVGQILATNIITFIEDELIEDGAGHILSTDNYEMQRNNGHKSPNGWWLSLNVCP